MATLFMRFRSNASAKGIDAIIHSIVLNCNQTAGRQFCFVTDTSVMSLIYGNGSVDDWTKTLIKAVENKPPIYDRTLKEHTDRPAMHLYWVEVCQAVIPRWNSLSSTEQALQEKVIQQKWRNLRTSFKREVNTQKKLSGTQNNCKRRRYIYYDQLKFLLPTIDQYRARTNSKNKKNKKSSIADTDCKPKHIQVWDDESEYSQDEEFIDEPSDRQATSVTSVLRFDNTDHISSRLEEPIPQQPQASISQPQESMAQSQQNKKDPSFEERLLTILAEKGNPEASDEDMLFLLSLVPSFKKMTDLQKIEAKIEFLSVIKRMSKSGST